MIYTNAWTAILFAILLLISVSAHERCGYEEHKRHVLDQDVDGSVHRKMEGLQKHYEDTRYKNEGKQLLRGKNRRLIDAAPVTSNYFEGILQIPVVVHILYNPNNGVNINPIITNERITSQILRLNTDYLGFNTETLPAGSGWDQLKANYSVTFKLKQIIRKETSHIEFFEGDDVFFDVDGGSNIIDSLRYLNLYVAVISSTNDVLGFCTAPGVPSNADGCVIHYQDFGDSTFDYDDRWQSTMSFDDAMGRTATHEIGHYFNLVHTFGDYSESFNEADQLCTDTDSVSDTPNQLAPHEECPTYPVSSCNSTESDMFMNYMDYTDDYCMALFTHGQLSRSLSIFNTVSGAANRNGLLWYQGYDQYHQGPFVNHIYFRVLSQQTTNTDTICGPMDHLISTNPISTKIAGKYIYGCYSTTNNLQVDVIWQIGLYYAINDYCMETNLNTVADPRYLCWAKRNFVFGGLTAVSEADISVI